MIELQEELTKGLINVEANEVPELLAIIDEIRLEFNLKSHADLTAGFAALLHEASENGLEYEHGECAKFISHQRSFMQLLE